MLQRLVFLVLLGVAVRVSADLPRIDLSAGMHRINAEVAYTDATRQQGLMHRKAMPAQDGMLFVFEAAAPYCMWMRNTFLSLSVAFLDGQGVIINIEDMKPQTEIAHCARGNAMYALEMNQGWFASRRIGAGARIVGIDRAPPAR